MSLLDDVRIVVTPNGYKARTLFAAIPSDGAADMDVTRATAATRVDENGLVNYAEVIGGELVEDGNFPTGTSEWTYSTPPWTISGGSANCDGTVSFSPINQLNLLTIGKQYKMLVDVSLTSGQLRIQEGSTILQTYTVVGSNTVEYYFTATGTSISFKTASTAFVGSIDNVSVKEVTRDNVPRIDYTGGGCPHILAEPQRTNVNTDSQDFSKSFYIKDSGVSVGDTNFVSPSGESNATQIEVNNNGRIYANVTSDTYASSVFIKAGTFAYFKIGGVNIDLVAGTNANGTIESLGSGWFRVGINYTGNRPFQIQAYPDGTYSSHTTDGNYYIWGSQIEAGSYATSYIPTSGSTVTRNQDIFTRDGIGSLINSQEGVLFAEIAALSNDGTNRYLTLTNGSTNERVALLFSGNTNQIRSIIFSSSQGVNVSLSTFSYDVLNFNKIAVRFKSGDFALYVNGTKVDSSTVTGEISSDTLNRLAFDVGNDTLNLFAKVKQLQVYESALTDVQLAALTK